jgi:hypothetical protein
MLQLMMNRMRSKMHETSLYLQSVLKSDYCVLAELHK